MIAKHIIIHHTATAQNTPAESINQSHKARGFYVSALGFYIGYHYLIGSDYIVQARQLDEKGYHAYEPWNSNSIAICLTGNYQNDLKPTEFQEKNLAGIIVDVMSRLKIPQEEILLHRDVGATVCPGKNITHQYIDNLLKDKFMTDEQKQALQNLKDLYQEKKGFVRDPMLVIGESEDRKKTTHYLVRRDSGLRIKLPDYLPEWPQELRAYMSAFMEDGAVHVKFTLTDILPDGGDYLKK